MISFVYFDLGGVVIRDFSGTNKWEEVKQEWGLTDKYWDEFEPKLCAGQEKISPDTRECSRRLKRKIYYLMWTGILL